MYGLVKEGNSLFALARVSYMKTEATRLKGFNRLLFSNEIV